jgi:hypothetical protein
MNSNTEELLIWHIQRVGATPGQLRYWFLLGYLGGVHCWLIRWFHHDKEMVDDVIVRSRMMILYSRLTTVSITPLSMFVFIRTADYL